MKPSEILFASALIALVGGTGAALATRTFFGAPARSPAEREPALAAEGPSAPARPLAELEELRRGQTELLQRLAALELRLEELASARTAVAPERAPEEAWGDAPGAIAGRPSPVEALELSPAFVASVEAALDRIQKAEEAEREKTRKELQAQRIEERVARLQQELGLTQRQASDVRSLLLAQDEKREALFAGLREGTGDPGAAREGFRALREDALAELERILTPDQYATYLKSEEAEFGRRGFGEFGPPGGRPPEGGFGRQR